MDTPTHALIPVIVYGVMRQEKLASGTREEKIAVLRNAVIIGIVGAMPDALDRHVTLEERLNSWTHCLAAWAGFSALFAGISAVRSRWLSPLMALGLSLTYLSHLVGDAIAGGIRWGYPVVDHVIGDYYVHPKWWIPANFACAIAAYMVYRFLPMRAANRRRRDELRQKQAAILEEAN